MYDIITIGSATHDAFLVSKEFKNVSSDKFVTGVGECVALGTKIDLDDLVLSTGGGATNAAVTFGNLGLKTAAIARVGQDCSGAEIVGELRQHHVETTLMRVIPGEQTAYSTLLTELKGGERTVLVYRGASARFTEADIPWSKMKSSWIYLTSVGNIPLVKKIITTAAKKGVNIAWNPGQTEIKAGLKTWKALLPSITVLILNREEAFALTEKMDLEEAFDALYADDTVRLITDGARGATVYHDGWMAHAKPRGVKAISRAGAGDAFGSGFVAGLIKSDNLCVALSTGMINAESVIQHYGAKKGIITKWPNEKEIKKIIIKEL